MRKHYSAQFKAEVVLEVLREEKTLAQIATERHVHPTMLHRWRNTVMKELPEVFARGERRIGPNRRRRYTNCTQKLVA